MVREQLLAGMGSLTEKSIIGASNTSLGLEIIEVILAIAVRADSINDIRLFGRAVVVLELVAVQQIVLGILVGEPGIGLNFSDLLEGGRVYGRGRHHRARTEGEIAGIEQDELVVLILL